MDRIADSLRKHRWWVALLLVVVIGYSVGKDLAFRDNDRDRAMSAEIGR